MTKSDAKNALKDFVKGFVKDPCLSCIVKSVDETKKTITVYSERDKVEYFDVRLMALAEEEAGNGILVLPKVGSQVIIGMIDGVDTMYFVAGYSEVDSVVVTIGNMKFKMDSAGIFFNDAQNGGLIKIDALVSDLNSIKSSINTLKSVLLAWVPVPSDGGLALKTAVTGWASAMIQNTVKANIEDTKVKH